MPPKEMPAPRTAQDQEDCGLRLTQAKKKKKLISTNMSGMVTHTCHPSYVGGIGRSIMDKGEPQATTQTLPEK
jgi:hypothetical protein